MTAWVKQVAEQVAKVGEENAPWCCFWKEPDGSRRSKRCGIGKKGKKLAEEKADRINAQLTLGTYDSGKSERTTWAAFAKEYQEKILSGLAATSSAECMNSLKHFARVLKLDEKPMAAITTELVDNFRAKRRAEKGKKPGSIISPATVNRDLRHVKAALRVAFDWKYIDTVPKIKFEKEPEKLPRYMTPEHFGAIYEHCDAATMPAVTAGAGAWWRGLLVMAQMTGWRIGELLALEWKDVDLEAARAKTRHSRNKGKRDAIVPLHSVVVDHLKPLKGFQKHVFPWPHDTTTLYVQFAVIQTAAGIKLDCNDDRKHTCTDACHRYAFHDERRAFATLNAPNMTRETLQALMRHQSPLTTAKYINYAKQVNPAVEALHVPKVLSEKSSG